jgi:PIN domain nuclease of toxin-antitoxin system
MKRFVRSSGSNLVRLLLDTHTFLFAIAQPEALPVRLRNVLLDPSVERWVSVVTHWEIAVKVHIGKLGLPSDPAYYTFELDRLRAKTLPMELRHALELHRLPLHHKDPFDRILISQAIVERMVFASRDRYASDYAVETIWA